MQHPELVQWQRLDPDNGFVQPWLTHKCLDWMKEKDWSDKTVIMFGAGLGDAWLAAKCKKLYVVERKEDWLIKAQTYSSECGANNIEYIFRPCNDGSGMQDFYVKLVDGEKIDVIINDDAYRTEICQLAVDYFTANGGGILVNDNWIQSFVWMSPKAEEIMQPYEAMIFDEPLHTDNDGVNKWKTAAWDIPG